MHRIELIICFSVILVFQCFSYAQIDMHHLPQPPDDFNAFDTPNDEGESITLTWKQSPDNNDSSILSGYKIYRAQSSDGNFNEIAKVSKEVASYIDKTSSGSDENKVNDGTAYYYRITSYSEQGESEPVDSKNPAVSKGQFFHTGKTPVFAGSVLFIVFVIFFIRRASNNPDVFVRPLAGINAIDEAVGRATEMGRPTLYVLGLGTASDIATIASFTILNRVAKKTAEYQTPLLVPCHDPIVMTIAQETVRMAYLDVGRPDLYSDDMVFFITSMQFAYVAAVNGLMLRDKTATNFYLGVFYAESLLLAETGNIAGSIQVAGTDQVSQLPFFITTCDYTLIGEELYAASAYLGRDPLLLGSLKAQDLCKAIVMLLLFLGVILMSFNVTFIKDLVAISMK